MIELEKYNFKGKEKSTTVIVFDVTREIKTGEMPSYNERECNESRGTVHSTSANRSRNSINSSPSFNTSASFSACSRTCCSTSCNPISSTNRSTSPSSALTVPGQARIQRTNERSATNVAHADGADEVHDAAVDASAISVPGRDATAASTCNGPWKWSDNQCHLEIHYLEDKQFPKRKFNTLSISSLRILMFVGFRMSELVLAMQKLRVT